MPTSITTTSHGYSYHAFCATITVSPDISNQLYGPSLEKLMPRVDRLARRRACEQPGEQVTINVYKWNRIQRTWKWIRGSNVCIIPGQPKPDDHQPELASS